MDSENKYTLRLVQTWVAAGLVLFAMSFYACDRDYVRTAHTREVLPLVETCITHSPVDQVKGGRVAQ